MFARDASGARQRIRHAAFPAHKTLEDFDFTAQPSAEKPLLLHLAQLAWISRTRQRLPDRPARDRQDAPGDRARDQGLPGRPPRRVRDRPAMGHAPGSRPGPQQPRRRTQAPRALRAAWSSTRSATCRSNARPPTCSSRSSRAATNAARSSSPANRDFRGLGRDPRRRDGRRRPHRPARPPRHHGRPQGQELPPARTRHRHRSTTQAVAAGSLTSTLAASPTEPRRLRRLAHHLEKIRNGRLAHFSVPETGALFSSR